MDHEAEIRLVEAHSESKRRHERLHLVVQQRPFQMLAVISGLPRVGFRLDPPRLEPFRHLVRVTDGERVDDPVAGEEGDLLGEPREALRLLGQPYRLKPE